jgi:hypothetical protein
VNLPRSYALALTLSVVLGFQVAFAAAFDVQTAIDYDQPPVLAGTEAPLPELGLSPLGHRQVALAFATGQRSALEAMLPWRTGNSLLLAIASGFVLAFAIRLWASEESRPAAAHQLGTAAMIAALLRAIDGGGNLVLMRTAMTEVGKALIGEGVPDAALKAEVYSFMFCAITVTWTVVILAGFVWLASYFRSDALRTALARAEP